MWTSKHISSHSSFLDEGLWIQAPLFPSFFKGKKPIKESKLKTFPIKRICINHPLSILLVEPNFSNTLKLIRRQFDHFHQCHSHELQCPIHFINELLRIFLNLGTIKIQRIHSTEFPHSRYYRTHIWAWVVMACGNTWKVALNFALVTFLTKGSIGNWGARGGASHFTFSFAFLLVYVLRGSISWK